MTPQDKAKPVWGGVTDSSSDEKYRIAAKWGGRLRQVSWVHLDKIHAGRTSKLAECTQNAMKI